MRSEVTSRVRALLEANGNAEILNQLSPGWDAGLPDEDRAILHHARGIAAFKLNDVLGALIDLDQAYALVESVADASDKAWIYNGYASVLGKMGDHAGAASVLATMFCSINPSGMVAGYVLWNWGWQSFKAGHQNHGLELLERASVILLAEKAPDLVNFVVDWSECLLAANRHTDAAAALGMASGALVTARAIWKSQYHQRKAEVLFAVHEYRAALANALTAFTYAREADNLEAKSRTSLLAARCYRAIGMSWDDLLANALDEGIKARDGQLIKSAIDLYAGGEVAE